MFNLYLYIFYIVSWGCAHTTELFVFLCFCLLFIFISPMMNDDKTLICFICKKKYGFDQLQDMVHDISVYENHLLKEHHIITPKFNDFNEIHQFSVELNSFDELNLNDRCSKFIMNK